MAETKEPTPTKGVIAKAGMPERGEFQSPNQNAEPATMGAAAEPAAPPASNGKQTAEQAAVPLPELTDDQIKELFAKKGIEGFDANFETLKEKMLKADTPVTVEPTAEEKKSTELAFEKRMLDFHTASGGTVEQFVALKQVAAMDLKELSVVEIKKEMKENGFDDSEIEIVLKERYFQLNPEELEQYSDELTEDFEKRKKLAQKKATYGSKKLENRSTHTQTNAKGILNDLREAVKAQDLEQQREKQFSSKVDEHLQKIAAEITLEMGEVDKTKLAPLTYNVSAADKAKVAEILKDPAKRQQYFFNEDKTLNLTKVTDVLLRNVMLESLAKAALIEGGNRQIAAFRQVFPNSPYALGVGGMAGDNTTGRKGVIKSAGQPEVAVPQR